jgi:translocation and assembly module TamB
LAQAENRLQQLTWSPPGQRPTRVVELKATGIHLGDTALGTLQANGKGDIRHRP